MTDRAKFEQMLEYLINEDQEKAKEIFHSIVVEKSREIYENLLAEDFDDIEEAKDDEEEMEEATDDEEEPVEEAKDDEEEMEEDFAFDEADDDEGPSMSDDDSMDATDDFMKDVGDEEGDDMDDQEQTDRILDLEAALDDLKAEFEKLMSDDDMGGDDMGGDDTDMDMDMGGDDMDMPKEEYDDTFMREYVEKVSAGHGAEKKGSAENADNKKSVVAGPNKMGGTTANIAKGGVEPESASTKGGLLNPSTKEDNAGNVNTPGSKNATKWNNTKGHGAEKKGAGEVGGTNTKSIIGR